MLQTYLQPDLCAKIVHDVRTINYSMHDKINAPWWRFYHAYFQKSHFKRELLLFVWFYLLCNQRNKASFAETCWLEKFAKMDSAPRTTYRTRKSLEFIPSWVAKDLTWISKNFMAVNPDFILWKCKKLHQISLKNYSDFAETRQKTSLLEACLNWDPMSSIMVIVISECFYKEQL